MRRVGWDVSFVGQGIHPEQCSRQSTHRTRPLKEGTSYSCHPPISRSHTSQRNQETHTQIWSLTIKTCRQLGYLRLRDVECFSVPGLDISPGLSCLHGPAVGPLTSRRGWGGRMGVGGGQRVVAGRGVNLEQAGVAAGLVPAAQSHVL